MKRTRLQDILQISAIASKYADAKVFHGLVKRWLQDLREDMEKALQARFTFENDLIGFVNKITCNLYASSNHIIDGFIPCQVLISIILPLHYAQD